MSTSFYVVSVDVCHDWPLGKCKRGNNCGREHHENLDPSLPHAQPEPVGYMVPDQVNAACQRCMQRMYPCDKLGRGGMDDPCSECRWFGGENCRCVLAKDTSYNDQIWSVMMNRGKAHSYTLPAAKPREEFNLKKGVAPGPMPTNKIKADWQGETKEALLAKPDMLPAGVRACPRAFLHPPRPSSAMKSTQNWAASNKRKLESDPGVGSALPGSALPGFALPGFPPRPDFPRPPAHPQEGEVLTASWSYSKNRWAYTYASGLEICGPPMPAPIGEQNSKPTERSTTGGSFAIHPKRQRTTPRVPTTIPKELNPAAAATTTPTTAISPVAVVSTHVMDLRMNESAVNDDDSIGYVSDDDN